MADPQHTHAHAAGLVVNLGLAVAKLSVGVAVGSQVLVADGMNSTGDVLATAIGWVGFRLARRPADADHPYGHGAFEAVAGLTIGTLLAGTGVFVTIDGLRALWHGPDAPPGAAAMGVAVVTAIVKEGLYRYTEAEGRRLNSPALRASARDHRADVFLAITVFAAVLAARLGSPWIDPLAATLVGVWVATMGYEPIRANLGVLLDEAPAEVTVEVTEVVAGVAGVVGVARVRVHSLGTTAGADVEVFVDPTLSVRAAHAIAREVEARVVAEVGMVDEVRVQVLPAG